MSEQITKAVEGLTRALTENPAAAKAVFRATTVSTEDALSTESRIRTFNVHLDEPLELGGTDTGPNPVEAVLAALGSCQAIVYRAYANALGLRIHHVEVDARGHLDVRGFLNLAPVAPGFERVTFTTRIVSPEPAEKIAQLARLVEDHCPVLDILRRPLEVSGKVEHAASADDRVAA
jgi:uncharacterized OsmC-like protein